MKKLTISWISSKRKLLWEREKVELNIKLNIFENQRNRNIYLRSIFYPITETLQISHESKKAIWVNVATRICVLQLWLEKESSELQPIWYQHSAMLIIFKYLIWLHFLQCCFFPFFVLTGNAFVAETYTSRKLQNYESTHGADCF